MAKISSFSVPSLSPMTLPLLSSHLHQERNVGITQKNHSDTEFGCSCSLHGRRAWRVLTVECGLHQLTLTLPLYGLNALYVSTAKKDHVPIGCTLILTFTQHIIRYLAGGIQFVH